MGRTHRQHQPGAAFHLVTRTQGHQFLFGDDLKREINRLVIDGIASGGARLIAHVVMSNHIHAVVFQGTTPLGWVMQPILRRVALLTQRQHKIEGHVFERKFRSKQCENTEHLRNCIRYVHRNPVEAKMCGSPSAYEFSSARAYEGLEPCGNICVEDGLQLFGCSEGTAPSESREEYIQQMARPFSSEDRETIEYWLRRRRGPSALAITRWREHETRPARDVRDAAVRILKVIDPAVDVDMVRSRYGGKQIVSARTELMATLLQRGYSGSCIARYMRVSPPTVSRIRSRMRWESAAAD